MSKKKSTEKSKVENEVKTDSIPENKGIVIKETEEDVVFDSAFNSNPDEFKEEVKKESERSGISKFIIALLVFLLIGVISGALTWYYAKPEKSVTNTEDKIQTPPQVPETNPQTTTPATTPATATTPAPSITPQPKTYTVQAGDTMSSIANANGLTSQELATYNNITDVNSLKIGQTLNIPVK